MPQYNSMGLSVQGHIPSADSDYVLQVEKGGYFGGIVKTNKGFYKVGIINQKKCSEYEDIECIEGLVKLEDVNKLKVTERMLFRFDWFKTWKTADFYKCFPYFGEEAVDFLIKGGIKLMAMDTPSPDYGGNIQSKEDSPNHKSLLKKDVVIVEYLTNTDQLDLSKKHIIIALPLKFNGCDGSPSRVIIEEY